jgi:hypothetical protein
VAAQTGRKFFSGCGTANEFGILARLRIGEVYLRHGNHISIFVHSFD